MKKYSLDEFWGKFALDLYDYDQDLFLEVCHLYRFKKEIPLIIFTKVVNKK